MPSVQVSNKLKAEIYFVTLTVKHWIYLFDKYERWEKLSSILKFYQTTRSLKIYSFVFMINHIHLIVQCEDMAAFIRDFKKYSTRLIEEDLKLTQPKLLKRFLSKANCFSFWHKTNMPIPLFSEKFFQQKKRYIENNPVKKGYVAVPENWYWSSANRGCELKTDVSSGTET